MSGQRLQIADGASRVYGIIGDPIEQVRSPEVFSEKFRSPAGDALEPGRKNGEQ